MLFCGSFTFFSSFRTAFCMYATINPNPLRLWTCAPSPDNSSFDHRIGPFIESEWCQESHIRPSSLMCISHCCQLLENGVCGPDAAVPHQHERFWYPMVSRKPPGRIWASMEPFNSTGGARCCRFQTMSSADESSAPARSSFPQRRIFAWLKRDDSGDIGCKLLLLCKSLASSLQRDSSKSSLCRNEQPHRDWMLQFQNHWSNRAGSTATYRASYDTNNNDIDVFWVAVLMSAEEYPRSLQKFRLFFRRQRNKTPYFVFHKLATIFCPDNYVIF